jgi:hypothetical protein
MMEHVKTARMHEAVRPLRLATIVLVLFGLGLTTAVLHGQAHIIKQRAKELVDQNNVRQGATPPAPTKPAPAVATPQPAYATAEMVQQYHVAKLQADLKAIQPGAEVTAAQKQQLVQDLTLASRGAVKPSPDALRKLADRLLVPLKKIQLPAADQLRLAQDLEALLNCASAPPAQVQSTITDAQAILQRNGADREAAVAVAKDLKTVAAAIQQAPLK